MGLPLEMMAFIAFSGVQALHPEPMRAGEAEDCTDIQRTRF